MEEVRKGSMEFERGLGFPTTDRTVSRRDFPPLIERYLAGTFRSSSSKVQKLGFVSKSSGREEPRLGWAAEAEILGFSGGTEED